MADRKTAILQAPKPHTKKQMMSFLGLTNYCHTWVPNYAEITAPLMTLMYKDELKMTSSLSWTPEAEESFVKLKQVLVGSTRLALPDYSKPFTQMVDCKSLFMTSVLTQLHGNKEKPIAYYSSKLDPVACAQPHCGRAVIAASMAVICSADIVLFHPLTLKVPHAVSALLLQTKMQFLSPARHLSCMSVLLSQPHVTVVSCTTLNPATLLPTMEDGDPHDCQALAETTAKSRIDLKDTPLLEGEVVFVDGSSSKDIRGKTRASYALVTATSVLKSGALPSSYSAQAAELVALTEACKAMKNKKATIYMDSQYAYATVHSFAQYWKNRGMVTSTGKPVTHAALLTDLLSVVHLLSQLAICKCAAHTNAANPVSLGNAFADSEAKKAAVSFSDVLLTETNPVTSDILKNMQEQSPTGEKQTWIKKGAAMKNGTYM